MHEKIWEKIQALAAEEGFRAHLSPPVVGSDRLKIILTHGTDTVGESALVNLLKICATTDGEHHRQYAIDQALRNLLGAEGYGAWREKQGADYYAGVVP